MARKPSRAYESDSDSDDAPEAVTNTQSKLAAKKKEAALQAAESERKRKRKDENRRREEALKKRKEETQERAVRETVNEGSERKGKKRKVQNDQEDDGVEDGPSSSRSAKSSSAGSKGGTASRMTVEERMERAMREAEDEENGDGDEDLEHDELASSDDGNMGADPTFLHGAYSEEDEDEGESDEEGLEGSEEDEEEGSSDGFDEDEDMFENGKSRYLPDHIFASALSSTTAQKSSKGKSADSASSRNIETATKHSKKRRSRRDGPKDLIVGSKTIRTIPSTTNPTTAATRAASQTVPHPKIRRLVKRSLALSKEAVVADRRGGKRTAAGWERKIVSIGNLRRSTRGPALRFVRS